MDVDSNKKCEFKTWADWVDFKILKYISRLNLKKNQFRKILSTKNTSVHVCIFFIFKQNLSESTVR